MTSSKQIKIIYLVDLFLFVTKLYCTKIVSHKSEINNMYWVVILYIGPLSADNRKKNGYCET